MSVGGGVGVSIVVVIVTTLVLLLPGGCVYASMTLYQMSKFAPLGVTLPLVHKVAAGTVDRFRYMMLLGVRRLRLGAMAVVHVAAVASASAASMIS